MTDPTPMDPSEPAPEPMSAPAAPAPAVSAPAPGSASAIVYADVPNRVIAYIIDIIVLIVLNIGLAIVLGVIGISAVSVSGTSVSTNWFGSIIVTAVSLAISAAYFIYSWTNQRATIGMKVLGLQIGNAPDGATIVMNEAVKRWFALGAIFSIAQVLNPLPFVGFFISLAALAWVIFLLYTTWKSPTKQGWHDVFASTMIVKATKSAA